MTNTKNSVASIIAAVLASTAQAAPSCTTVAETCDILFVGNSYTFGRIDPVLSYNAANVRDLTRPQGPLKTDNSGLPFTNLTNTNSYPAGTVIGGETQPSYSPHFKSTDPTKPFDGAWGGVPGIFKQMTAQAGLFYDVSLSTRNAASLRGHFLNTANPNWNLQGNLRLQAWDKVVLQEQSDEPLTAQTPIGSTALSSNFQSFRGYADMIEDYIHQGSALSYREREIPGLGQNSNTPRTIVANSNANPDAQIYLQQTWARPNLINAPGATTIDPATGNATYSGAPAASFFDSLEEMTADLKQAYAAAATFAATDNSGGFAGVIPVGEAFLKAVTDGVATRDMYAGNAGSDGLIDLWFNDGTHASVYGSYLSALTLFGSITGLDPQSLGFNETAARDLGISSRDAYALQQVAAAQLGFARVPEPGTLALMLPVILGLAAVRRKRNA